MKNRLLIGASAVAVMLSMSDQALASSECGIPSSSGNPYVVSCISDPAQYQNGITYSDSAYATPAGLKIDIYGTAIVAPINNATAVSVTGTANHDATIYVRNGATITSGGNGLLATTSGTGTASIDNHASVTSGGIGLSAVAGSTGFAGITNESDGKIVIVNGTNGLTASGGSATVINYGAITGTNTLSSGSPFVGLAVTTTGNGGIATIQNVGTASFSADNVAVAGLASLSSSGAVLLSNSGTLTVNASTNAAKGFYVAGSGTPGAVALDNSGLLSVTGGTSAVGMDVRQGTSVVLTSEQAVTVAGAAKATGFAVAGASGPVSVQLQGASLAVSSSAGSATGISISGGSNDSVTTQTNTPIAISAGGGTALGIGITGASGSETVTLGNAWTVSNTQGAATGVSLAGGTSQSVTLGQAITVQSSGADARGLDLSGGAATVHLNTPITVSSDTGAVYGLADTGGSTLAVDGAAAITVTSAGNAYGVSTSAMTDAQTLSLGTITATSTAGQAYGVALSGSGAITLSDASVITAKGTNLGAGVLLQVYGASTPQAIIANLATVTTAGTGIVGILAEGDTGNIAVTATTVTTTGSNAHGILAVTQSGALAITATQVAVSGAGSVGVLTSGGSGATMLHTGTVTAGTGSSYGIQAISSSGSITLNANQTSAASADAIHIASGSGAVTVNLADGSSTTGGAAGVSVNTGGTAVINLGNSANNAVLYGATAGLTSTATGGQIVNLTGTVGAANGLAVALSGGASTLNASGTINGYMTLAGTSNVVNNSGVWNAYAGDSTFSGTSTLNNSGTINVFPVAVLTSSAGATLRLAGLTTLNNSGTITLANRRTGDALSVSGAVVGSGSSRLVIDANLGLVALAGAGVGTADQLVAGSVSGKTTLVVNDLGAASVGTFNFGGIRVVTSSAIAPGSVVLQGGPITKGFATYQLMSDLAGNLDLVGLPSTSAFELIRTSAEAQKYWRRSADAWAGQMQALETTRGPRMWMQVYGGDQTDHSRPVDGATVLGQAVSFTPNLDIEHSWGGVQLGYQLGRGHWAVGVTGGYGQQTGSLKATHDEIRLSGGNIGAYLRVKSDNGAYANVLAKVDRYHVSYTLSGGAVAPGFDGTTYGLDIRTGYHLSTGKAFVEPQLGFSWTHSDLDGFTTPAGDLSASFHHTDSAYGSIGLRAGLETRSGAWAIKPYVGAAYEGELNGTARTLLVSGGSSLDYADASEGGHARVELGVQGNSRALSVFGKVEGVAGSNAKGLGGSLGLALRW